MSLHWTDVNEIAIQLAETHAEVNPLQINFVELRNWVMALPEFSDDPARCGEKILEAIQKSWIEELD
jgi:FeS assembly protein IscX